MNILANAKNFASNHKVAIAVIVTAVVCITISRIGVRQFDEFLKEHDLLDEYYLPE